MALFWNIQHSLDMADNMISITVDSKGIVDVKDKLNHMITRLPKAFKDDTLHVTEMYCDEMRRELTNRKIFYTHELIRSLKPMPTENGYQIPIPVYGHYVDKKTGPRKRVFSFFAIKSWAESKGISENDAWKIWAHIMAKGTEAKNWITPSVERARSRLTAELENGKVLQEARNM